MKSPKVLISLIMLLLPVMVSCGSDLASPSVPDQLEGSNGYGNDLVIKELYMNDEGKLVIPNQLNGEWDGRSLLGSQSYQISALD